MCDAIVIIINLPGDRVSNEDVLVRSVVREGDRLRSGEVLKLEIRHCRLDLTVPVKFIFFSIV